MKFVFQIFISIVPLIVSFSTTDPTLTIRFLFILSGLSIFLFYFLITKNNLEISYIRNPIILCVFTIIISYILSSIVNDISSQGIYEILRLWLFIPFIIITTHFLKKYGNKIVFIPLIIFSLTTSLIYIYQFLDNYTSIINIEEEWKRNREFDAIASTMGHKNLLASIQFLILPILIYNLKSNKKILKISSILAILFIIFILFQTQSRGVIIACIIFFISYITLIFRKLNKKYIIKTVFICLTVLLGGFYIIKSTERVDALKKEISKSIDYKKSGRFKLYSSTINLVKDNFLLGVGPGNWSVSIWEYGLYQGAKGVLFAQRPHNDFLWFFAEGGVFAGISYILIFLILLRDSYKLSKSDNYNKRKLFSLVFSSILGFGFISFFDFPVERISHNIVFLTIISIIIAEKDYKLNKIASKKIILLAFIFCLYSINIAKKRYDGDLHTKNAIEFKNNGNWSNLILAINRAYNKTYYDRDNTSTPLLWYRGVAHFNLKNYNLAYKDFKNAYQVHPYNVHVLNNLGTSYELMKNSEKAKEFYNKAIKINTTFKESRINLSAILFNEKKYEEALDVILQSKVDNYWKRKRNFNNNYDKYLKVIVNSWSKSHSNISKEESKKLEFIAKLFDKDPNNAEKIMRKLYNFRISNQTTYLNALINEK